MRICGMPHDNNNSLVHDGKEHECGLNDPDEPQSNHGKYHECGYFACGYKWHI